MRALGILSFGLADKLELLDVPKPELTGPHDILVKVAGVALNPAEAVKLRGYSRLLETVRFPLIIGHDFAGTVVSTGSAITAYRPGDRVFGFTLRGGACVEYLLLTPPRPNTGATERYTLAHAPPSLSFVQACSLATAGHTTIESLAQADKDVPGGLRGKVVFVSAGLSGVGSLAVQVAKNVYGAGKVITTVSTGKVAKVDGLLGTGVVDQIVDYSTQNPVEEIGKEKVDFMLDTVFTAMSSLPVMKSGGVGRILTITGKSGKTLGKDWPEVPWWLLKLMDLGDAWFKWRAWRWGVVYDHVYVALLDSDLELLAKWVEEGKVRPVVGRAEKMSDIEAVREILSIQMAVKGGLGRLVIDLED